MMQNEFALQVCGMAVHAFKMYKQCLLMCVSWWLDCMQFDIIMLDVAAPDPAADPGTLNSIPAQFLSADFVLEGLHRRLR